MLSVLKPCRGRGRGSWGFKTARGSTVGWRAVCGVCDGAKGRDGEEERLGQVRGEGIGEYGRRLDLY